MNYGEFRREYEISGSRPKSAMWDRRSPNPFPYGLTGGPGLHRSGWCPVVNTGRGTLTAYLNGRVLKCWPYKLLND